MVPVAMVSLNHSSVQRNYDNLGEMKRDACDASSMCESGKKSVVQKVKTAIDTLTMNLCRL